MNAAPVIEAHTLTAPDGRPFAFRGAPQQSELGTNYVGLALRASYISAGPGRQWETYRVACVGPADVSPVARQPYGPWTGNIEYHPACPCCWLGHSHTTAAHARYTEGHPADWFNHPDRY
jgi:hypothetical protein